MTGWTTLVDAPALRRADGIALFDCRHDLADPDAGGRAYRAGHLPGARFLHLDHDLAAPASAAAGRHPLPDRATLAATLRAAGLAAGQQVVAYDDAGGAFAARLWWLLRWLGHAAVAVLDGGLPAWTAAGGPLATGAPPPARAGDFALGRSLTAVADADAAAVAPRLLDARAAERFAGAPHPLDPRPGHIPGALSRPFRDNLGPDGRFKPAAALRADYMALLAGVAPADVVLYCGSGVTAAHDLLAMHHAGLPGAALYPGSWSQWAADPTRPVAPSPA